MIKYNLFFEQKNMEVYEMTDPSGIPGLPEGTSPVAKVTKNFLGLKVAGVQILTGAELREGDTIFFIREDTGDWDSRIVDSIERNRRKIKVASAGELVGVFIGTAVKNKSTIHCLSQSSSQ
ncbi:MAG: hypothetical protein ABH837_02870 [bacterium]